MRMTRPSFWLGVVCLSLVLFGGGYYWWSGSVSMERKAQKPAIQFLPDNVQSIGQVSLKPETLRQVSNFGLFQRLRSSPFKSAYNNRIKPLLKLSINQFKANTPYPSGYLLRHFLDGRLITFSEPGFGRVLLLETAGDGARTIDNRLKEWVVTPARKKSNWQVRKLSSSTHTIWELQYNPSTLNRSIKGYLGIENGYILLSYSREPMKRAFDRYHKSTSTKRNDLPKLRGENRLVGFVSLHSPVSSFPNEWSQFEKIVRENGGVLVQLDARDRYWDLKMKLKDTSDTIAQGRSPAQSVLKYSPDSAPLILHLKSPKAILLRERIMGQFHVITPEVSALLADTDLRKVIDSASLTLTWSNRNGTDQIVPLVVFRSQQKQLLKRKLDRVSRQSTSQADTSPRPALVVGSTRYYRKWSGSDVLLSPEPRILAQSRRRGQSGTGFPDSIAKETMAKKLRHPYRTFVYMNSSSLTDRFKLPDKINPSSRKLITLLFGFNPAQKLGKMVSRLPATALFVRQGEADKLTRLTLSTAGDVFLPVLLRDIFLPQPDQYKLPNLSNPSFSSREWLNSLR